MTAADRPKYELKRPNQTGGQVKGMANRVPITIRLDQFEGPLDLLLYLIQSHEMNISMVSISKITDQYLETIRLMEELNFDIASDFLVMAATLLQWKSKAILPQDEEEQQDASADEDDQLTPEDLVRQLLEHQRFLAAGDELSQIPRLNEDVFTRPNKKIPIERIWKDMNVTDLVLGYQDAIATSRRRKKVLRKETVSLTDKILEFGERLELGKLIEMKQLMSLDPDRAEIVVTFLASLELSRLKKLKVYQDGTYQPIFLELIETLRNFDLGLASGFDNIEEQTRGPSENAPPPIPPRPENAAELTNVNPS